MKTPTQTRRSFLKTAALAAGFPAIIPAGVLRGSDAPSNKLNIALIGAGGRARAHFGAVSGENVVALCDVNDQTLVDLLIGKRSGSGCFVREADGSRVYVTDHNFLSDFGLWGEDRPVPEVKDWVNLVAFEVPREEVTRVQIEGDASLVLDRELIMAETDSLGQADGLAGSPGAIGRPC